MDSLSSVLLALLVVGYLVLAGADVGLGMLMPHVARGTEQRRRVVAAIAPYFLASEVWLVAAVGVLAGMFPVLDHHAVTELWPVLAALLAGWLVRDAGLWLRARVDGDRWRLACDGAIVAGSWTLAAAWGLTVAGLLTDGLTASPFTVLCAVTVMALFALRGAAFGAERLVGPADSGGAEPECADVAARDTRVLARAALCAAVPAGASAALPGGPVLAAVPVAVVLTTVLLVALAATSGLAGPMLSRHTSAAAIAVPGLLVALAAQLPSAPIPSTVTVLVWAVLVPVVPVMFVGQVWLYRMTRRPAAVPTFFA
ncbi:cytochrome bd-type quinol oxidase subunit 2 [Nocardiopsis arvandica]|uniref:Cytochrome bd-type quinol oxidase subunit 2 n=1 Tax=Nocardiopsis sinuspersici TaxID=501010 RepID=A0A7Y9X983_9ACTN|nr:cytochrome d ubiquinol oxidase subunit II [Nocardiopsis sinuspersici]NYH51562.1 cytochrome bd-type quinol oxidase subunit 2 [Nocardiopsis sinuspersici]